MSVVKHVNSLENCIHSYKEIFPSTLKYCSDFGGHIWGCLGLHMAQFSEIATGKLRERYGMPGIEPGIVKFTYRLTHLNPKAVKLI